MVLIVWTSQKKVCKISNIVKTRETYLFRLVKFDEKNISAKKYHSFKLNIISDRSDQLWSLIYIVNK